MTNDVWLLHAWTMSFRSANIGSRGRKASSMFGLQSSTAQPRLSGLSGVGVAVEKNRQFQPRGKGGVRQKPDEDH